MAMLFRLAARLVLLGARLSFSRPAAAAEGGDRCLEAAHKCAGPVGGRLTRDGGLGERPATTIVKIQQGPGETGEQAMCARVGASWGDGMSRWCRQHVRVRCWPVLTTLAEQGLAGLGGGWSLDGWSRLSTVSGAMAAGVGRAWSCLGRRQLAASRVCQVHGQEVRGAPTALVAS